MRLFVYLAVLGMLGMGTGSLAAEPSDEGVDLLAGPLDSQKPYAWKHFSEDPKTAMGDVWQLRDGVLVCRGLPKGYLFLDHDFTNFTLRLEWRWPEGKAPGNGGVLVRITGPDRVWPRSLEAQLNAGQAGDFWGLAGYSLDGPAERKKVAQHPQFGRLTNLRKTENLEKPAGQWNTYQIVARGPVVTLTVNGKEVNRTTDCELVPGRICLTAEGNEIHFRNLRFTPLEK